MLRTEHGGMNEVLADVAALTGDPTYLALARRFSHEALLAPLAEARDPLDGLHANTQIPKVVGFQRIFDADGRGALREGRALLLADGGRPAIVRHRRPRRRRALLPARRLRQASPLGEDDGDVLHAQHAAADAHAVPGRAVAAYADYYERALYNGILASQDPESGMMTYFQATRPGYVRLFHTPERSFWCCTGTGMENHAKYGDSIYFHERRRAVGQSLHPVGRDVEGEGAHAAADDQLSRERGTHLTVTVEQARCAPRSRCGSPAGAAG